jgi:hypothetical protein
VVSEGGGWPQGVLGGRGGPRGVVDTLGDRGGARGVVGGLEG